jgi:YD repeat-containing protein
MQMLQSDWQSYRTLAGGCPHTEPTFSRFFQRYGGRITIIEYLCRITLHYNSAVINGNLETLKRWAFDSDSGSKLMDNLSYNYKEGTNQLTHVDDSVDDDVFLNIDIDDQDENYTIDGVSYNNYNYDEIGQLTKDISEGLDIEWRVDGKVSSITKSDGQHIAFTYDGLGNRISKIVTDAEGELHKTNYQRDAQGNVLAVYTFGGNSSDSSSNVNLYLPSGNITSTHTEEATNGIYVAGSGIYDVEEPNGDLTLKAGNEIILNPGFTAEAGSKFFATIEMPDPEDGPTDGYRLEEHHIYGSSRLGIQESYVELDALAEPAPPPPPNEILGTKDLMQRNAENCAPGAVMGQSYSSPTFSAWVDEENSVSLFEEVGLSEHIEIDAKFKLDEAAFPNDESLRHIGRLTGYHYHNRGKKKWSHVYRSFVSTYVKKTTNNEYIAVLELLKFNTDHYRRLGKWRWYEHFDVQKYETRIYIPISLKEIE